MNDAIVSGTTNTTPGSLIIGRSDRLAKPWRISKLGRDFIISFEKVRTEIYLDQAGLPTIGIGHLLTQEEISSGVFRNGISKTQAAELFGEEIKRYEARASEGIKVPLHQHEFDALVSLAYNTWAALGKDSNIVKKLNAGLYHAVPDEIVKYDKIKEKGTGRIIASKGLHIRRLAEIDIFKDANYNMHS